MNASQFYYLYRFYDPNLQRWPNRDPRTSWPKNNHSKSGLASEEDPYEFVKNDPLSNEDPLGLCSKSCCEHQVAVGGG